MAHNQLAASLARYEKYDSDMKKKGNNKNQDAFTEELEELQAEVDKLMAIAAEVALESNRAAVASKNAEIRRETQGRRAHCMLAHHAWGHAALSHMHSCTGE